MQHKVLPGKKKIIYKKCTLNNNKKTQNLYVKVCKLKHDEYKSKITKRTHQSVRVTYTDYWWDNLCLSA